MKQPFILLTEYVLLRKPLSKPDVVRHSFHLSFVLPNYSLGKSAEGFEETLAVHRRHEFIRGDRDQIEVDNMPGVVEHHCPANYPLSKGDANETQTRRVRAGVNLRRAL